MEGKKITKKDFMALASNLLLTENQVQNSFNSFSKKLKSAQWWIESSFLPEEQKSN